MLGLGKLFNSLTGKNRDKPGSDGETALTRAVKEGNLTKVKKLLHKGHDPNIQNSHHLTPLHLAAYWDEKDIIDALLKAKADPNATNGKGWTPLHSAALAGGMKSRKKVIEKLKKAGGRSDIPDKNGWTAEEYMAIWAENAEAAAKLRDIVAAQIVKDSASKEPDSTEGKVECGRCHKMVAKPCGPAAPRH
jgi:ankyrin repeat protein